MKIVWMVIVVTVTSILYCGESEYVLELTAKEKASFSDLVISFCYLYDLEVTDNFEENLDKVGQKITYLPKNQDPRRNVTVGDFSLFAMQYLGLKSGIFYLATKSGRYASRELMMRLLIPRNTSEHEILSGVELLRNIQKVVDYENQD